MDGHVRGRERYVFSICLVCAIPELILAIVIVFLFPFDRFLSFSNFRMIYQRMYLVNDREVIRTRNEIMHSGLLNVNENGCRSAKTPLFV